MDFSPKEHHFLVSFNDDGVLGDLSDRLHYRGPSPQSFLFVVKGEPDSLGEAGVGGREQQYLSPDTWARPRGSGG